MRQLEGQIDELEEFFGLIKTLIFKIGEYELNCKRDECFWHCEI